MPLTQNRRHQLFDIPARYAGRFLNNYEVDNHLVLSEHAFQSQLQSSVLRHGSTKVVWNGTDRMQKGDLAVIYLRDPSFNVMLVKISKRRCEIQVPAVNGGGMH